MIDFVKEGRVGDRVNSIRGGEGVIIAIYPESSHPIAVTNDKDIGRVNYTKNGMYGVYDQYPALTFASGNITIDQGTPPERKPEIDWQRVIDEEFCMGFSDSDISDAKEAKTVRVLERVRYSTDTDYSFKVMGGSSWKYAAIPSMKGIRKPHFDGDCPCDPEQLVMVKFEKSDTWTSPRRAKTFHWFETPVKFPIVEYIELP